LGNGPAAIDEGVTMRFCVLAGLLSGLCVLSGGYSAAAAGAERAAGVTVRTIEQSAQQHRRTRITVTPRRAAVGPNSVRQCRAWLAQEARPSGTVIVPRQQCCWE
jgi:hypothetical protein